MSWKNLKLRAWNGHGETRVYVNAGHVDPRDPLSMADGGYLVADDTGGLRWKHGFRTGPSTIARAERVAHGMQEVIRFLNVEKFDELMTRLDACKTKGGNFSAVKYEKMYNN